ncbi:MAG: MBL fold metallo-hydrolase, partial [Armatimonadota bacterium]|nr:MBL fold metallo-hydrolase [Armatimonadota bacterium]
NVGVLHHGEEALLIDVGDGAVLDVLAGCGIRWVDGVLLTHHHRDQAEGAPRVLETGGWTGAPEAERALFEEVEAYWADPSNRWHLYRFRPHNVLSQSVPIHRTFVDGDTLRWTPARITALQTPGHTDGSMTYLVDVDGQRIAFCGDLIFSEGQILDIYSLQKGFGGLTDYHGYMGAWREVIASLRRIEAAGATVLVPSHGHIIRDPKSAIDLLESRLQAVYENYLSTSALWYYFPELLRTQSPTAQPLAVAPSLPVPSFLRHVGTSWMIRSESGHLLVMDCGSEEVVRQVEQWLATGEVTAVDALWITHYHDDHVDAIPLFRQRFGCPIIAEASVAQVVSQPERWWLPCQSPWAIPVDRVVQPGERWRWQEFTLTAYHFPGQTLYHGGLLVEGKGMRLFFCGDSFTPTGLDDYCTFNINLLGEGVGYDFCLQLLEELRPDMLLNCHVEAPFAPSPADLRQWREALRERYALLQQLLPCEDPNDGIYCPLALQPTRT